MAHLAILGAQKDDPTIEYPPEDSYHEALEELYQDLTLAERATALISLINEHISANRLGHAATACGMLQVLVPGKLDVLKMLVDLYITTQRQDLIVDLARTLPPFSDLAEWSETAMKIAEVLFQAGLCDEAARYYRQIGFAPVPLSIHVLQKLRTVQPLLADATFEVLCSVNTEISRALEGRVGRCGPIGKSAPRPRRAGPVRLGLMCDFFQTPSVDMFLLSFLEYIPAETLEIFLYGGSPPQKMPHNLNYFATRSWSVDDFHNTIGYDHDIDIVIDLNGPIHAGPGVTALIQRMAPLQGTYFNHITTTALTNMDFILTDVVYTPLESRRFYSERLVYLETLHCAAPAHVLGRDVQPPYLRTGVLTFAYFGNPAKLNPALLSCWRDILVRTPDSRLLISHYQFRIQGYQTLLGKQLAAVGIPLGRVIIHQGIAPQDAHLLYSLADIILDPFPYSGGHTMIEALANGIPTANYFQWDKPMARYSALFLHAAGLSEFVVHSTAAYVDAYCRLAVERDRRSMLRGHIQDRLVPRLLDCERFAQGFSRAIAEDLFPWAQNRRSTAA